MKARVVKALNGEYMNECDPEQKSYFRLFLKNRLLSVIFTSITPLILVSVVILYQFYTSYQEKVYAHLETLVNKHKVNIDSFLNDKLADIRFLADSFSLDELNDELFLQGKLTSLQREYGPVFVDLGVIDEKGIQTAYAGPFKLGRADYSGSGWFAEAVKSQYFISDVFLGLRGLPHFIVTVRQEWEGERWILRATIDFNAFNTLVENIRIGQTGFAFILNRDGEFQTRKLHAIDPMKSPYPEFLKSDNRGEVRITEQSDGFSDKNIYVFAFLKEEYGCDKDI